MAKANSNPEKRANNELAALIAKRDSLEGRKSRVRAEIDTARTSMRDAIVADADANVREQTKTIGSAEEELSLVDGLLADADRQIKACEQEIISAKQTDERERAADALDSAAENVLEAARRLDITLDGVADAFAALLAAIPSTLNDIEIDYSCVDGPALARAILADIVAGAMPEALNGRYDSDWREDLRRTFRQGSHLRTKIHPKPDTLLERGQSGAAELVVEKLRETAEAVRAGDADIPRALSASSDQPVVYPPPPAPPKIEIIVRQDFQIVDEIAGTATDLRRFETQTVDADLAIEAIGFGMAYRLNDPRAESMRYERPSLLPSGQRWAVVRPATGPTVSKILTEGTVTISRAVSA